ncbi:MAG: DUF177 domain-containing protein [Deltaproteobacteria bacterium]|nr:DUF177 domain-containing protein [Deltaproteobacteria bacterium]
MKLKVSDIPTDGLELTAALSSDPWLRGVVRESFQKEPGDKDEALVDLLIEKTCDNVRLRGVASLDLERECDRCLTAFCYHSSVPIEMTLTPLPDSEGDGPECLTAEDENFAFYREEKIDLSDIVREALVLSIPIRFLCSETCKGLCPRCRVNLNLRECECDTQSGNSHFAALKKFQFKKTTD